MTDGLVTLLAVYLSVGAAAGLLAGLLGVGGGQVVVPALLYVFAAQQVARELAVHLALGTSLATIAITSLASIHAHARLGAVQGPVLRHLAPGIVVGGLAGAQLASLVRGEILTLAFGGFLLALATQMALELRPRAARALPAPRALAIVGGAIGAVSAIVGVGGGSMIVPFLTWCGVAMRQAVATAAACGLPIAASGALGFALSGRGHAALPAWSTGYIYWPACAAIAGGSLVTAALGARLAHRLPTAALRRVFAVFLAIAGVRLLVS